MEFLGKPFKFGPWQVQKIIDNYGVKKVQIKYFNRRKGKSLNFSKFQALYVKTQDWIDFKKEIRLSMIQKQK